MFLFKVPSVVITGRAWVQRCNPAPAGSRREGGDVHIGMAAAQAAGIGGSAGAGLVCPPFESLKMSRTS